MKATLVLEDGKSFTGEAQGRSGEAIGEVILNTAVVGYQEMLTDPANAGKILVLTYPLIGNYGAAPKFNESKKVRAAGLVVKEKSSIVSNWQAKESLDDFVRREKLLVITGVDTRTLAVHLRQKGEMPGAISTSGAEGLLAKLAAFKKEEKTSALPGISVNKAVALGVKGKKIAVLDLGITQGILRQIERLGLSITLFPYNTPAGDILRIKPRGLIISGGPEGDPGLNEVIPAVKELINKMPILGIATGFQVLARAMGAKLVKMKLGHRGVNYPVSGPVSYKGEITVQNHAYAVDTDSLNKIKGVKVTGYNLNDRTVEEIESVRMKIIGVQYVPASPGFDEVNNVFKRFMKLAG